jgi:uncharacterized protein YjdB
VTTGIVSRRALGAALLVGAAQLAACAHGGPTDPADTAERLEIRFTAQVTAVVEGVSVEISAVDIDPPSIQNVPVTNGVASGTIEVAPGSDRHITVRAYDVRGIETHAGATTIDVLPGTNLQVSLTLEPVSGDVPILVELVSYVVTLTPATSSLAVDDTLRLTVTVEDGGGNPIADPQVAWGSTAPSVAWVDQAGFVIAVAPGSTIVAANYRGTVALAEISVF